MRRSSTTN